MNKLKEKRNEEPEEELEGIINGDQYFEILQPPFHIWTIMKTIFKEMGPLTLERHSEEKLALENIEENNISVCKY